MTGRVVRVLSMKLSEAQKRPERALVRISHLRLALRKSAGESHDSEDDSPNLLFIRIRLQPSPQLNASAALTGAVPGPRTPCFSVPTARAEPQMQLSRASMLQDLAQGTGEEAEVSLLKLGDGGVGAEVEAGEEGGLG